MKEAYVIMNKQTNDYLGQASRLNKEVTFVEEPFGYLTIDNQKVLFRLNYIVGETVEQARQAIKGLEKKCPELKDKLAIMKITVNTEEVSDKGSKYVKTKAEVADINLLKKQVRDLKKEVEDLKKESCPFYIGQVVWTLDSYDNTPVKFTVEKILKHSIGYSIKSVEWDNWYEEDEVFLTEAKAKKKAEELVGGSNE